MMKAQRLLHLRLRLPARGTYCKRRTAHTRRVEHRVPDAKAVPGFSFGHANSIVSPGTRSRWAYRSPRSSTDSGRYSTGQGLLFIGESPGTLT